MDRLIQQEIINLKKIKHIDKSVINKFLKKIELGNITRTKDKFSHYCTFFLPINIKTKTIYLGHHIKANDWIPPGGHLELNETPLDTVKREFEEELSYKLSKEKIIPFDLSIKDISSPRNSCKLHYDFWYLVYINKINFIYNKAEFYLAKWFSLKEALSIMKLREYKNIVIKLKKFI